MAPSLFMFLVPAVVLVLVLLAFGLWPVVRSYWKFRGTRVITCPETKAPAAVQVDARHAALTVLEGGPNLRLKDCSRWPERRNCGQECLPQIEAAPGDCLLRNILTKWYEGKACALCGRPLGTISWTDHQPALINAERRTFEWSEIPPEKVFEVLTTHQPVCWNCHIAETFRRLYPERVLDRERPEAKQGQAAGSPTA